MEIYILQKDYLDKRSTVIETEEPVVRRVLSLNYFTHEATGTKIHADLVLCNKSWFLPQDECLPPVDETTSPIADRFRQKSNPDILGSFDAETVAEAFRKIQEIAEATTKAMLKKHSDKITLEDCYFDNGNDFYIKAERGNHLPIITSRFLSCETRIGQLIALCDCMAVADKVNGEKHWKPENNEEAFGFGFDADHNDIVICRGVTTTKSSILFKTSEGAKQGRDILGHKTIKTALGL